MTDLYIEFTAPISDWRAIQSFSQGVGSDFPPEGRGRRAQPNDFTVVMERSAFTRKIAEACARGTTFERVWIELYKDDLLILRYTLESCLVSSASETKTNAQFSLSAEKVSWARSFDE